jgi:hypothetical protein
MHRYQPELYSEVIKNLFLCAPNQHAALPTRASGWKLQLHFFVYISVADVAGPYVHVYIQ